MTQTPVLICGAGPSGLVLALELAYYNIPFRIIDKACGPGETSRAMLVVPKVLESYQKFGLDKTVSDKGIIPDYAHFHSNNKRVASLPMGIMGKGLSRYPYLVTFPQDAHEQVLIDKLNHLGIKVEWETELVSLNQHEDRSEAGMRHQGEMKTGSFTYIIGCDGASSQVRKLSETAFEGDTYEQIFYVMDAEVNGKYAEGDAGSFSFIKDYFALFFPLRDRATTRVIGMFPPDLTQKNDLSSESLIPRLEEAFNIKVKKMNWFSDYKIHARTAGQFKMGNHFLVGDAAHIHSPIGGQGMNLGIGDATNLGWKLAQVIDQHASDKLLETYEEERKEIAKFVVSTTDRMFSLIVGNKTTSMLTRQLLIPVVARLAGASHPFQKRLYTLLSQLYISYEESPLSRGSTSYIKAGQRLPYVDSEPFEFTREAGWQLHTFIPLNYDLLKKCKVYRIDTIQRKWTDKARDKRFEEDHLILVRPDGYIGWMGPIDKQEDLSDYIEQWLSS